MLVLTRRVGEAVMIDGGIKVEVVEIRGNRVVLGFTAPDSVHICKAEFFRGSDTDEPTHSE